MKKILLSAAAVALATTAINAENPKLHEVYPLAGEVSGELSPTNFVGATATDIPAIYSNEKTSGIWNLDNHYIVNLGKSGDVPFASGVIALAGGFGCGGQAHVDAIKKGFSLVDLGGSCGKVLVLNGLGSKLEDALKAEGANVTVPQLDQLPGLPIFHWIPNPAVLEPLAMGNEHLTVRCSIEFNLYHNVPADAAPLGNLFMNDDESNARENANGKLHDPWNMKNFWYTWADKSDETSDPFDQTDTSAWYDEDAGEGATATPHWNPNRWMVFEFDFSMSAKDADAEDWNYAPRLKMEIAQGFLNGGGAILIRSVKFSEVKDEGIPAGTSRYAWNWYTFGAGAGVENVAVDNSNAPAEYFNLQGVRVNNPENGVFICRQGNKVTKVVK